MKIPKGFRNVVILVGVAALLILAWVLSQSAKEPTSKSPLQGAALSTEVVNAAATAWEESNPTTVPVVKVPPSMLETAQAATPVRTWENCPTRFTMNHSNPDFAITNVGGGKVTIEAIGVEDSDPCLFVVQDAGNASFDFELKSAKWQIDVRFSQVGDWIAYNGPSTGSLKFTGLSKAILRFLPATLDIFYDPYQRMARANRAGQLAGYVVYNGNLGIADICPDTPQEVVSSVSANILPKFESTADEWQLLSTKMGWSQTKPGTPWIFTATTKNARRIAPPAGSYLILSKGGLPIWGLDNTYTTTMYAELYCFLEKAPQ
jgi:hypothetical protein